MRRAGSEFVTMLTGIKAYYRVPYLVSCPRNEINNPIFYFINAGNLMPFDENGFLGKDVLSLTEDIRNKYKKLFQLCCEINRFVEKTKFEFKPHSENRQELISTCLFIKLLEGVQAAIILIRTGLDADAQIVLRGVFETLIHLVLCVEEVDYSFEYLNKYDINRLALMKKAHEKNEHSGVWADIQNLSTKESIAQLEKEIHEKGFDTRLRKFHEKYNLKKLAERAKLSDLYESFYAVVSDYAHANPLSLNRYVATDKDGKIFQLNHGPSDNYAKSNLIASAEFALSALSAMCKLFDVNKDSDIKEFHKRLDDITTNLRTPGSAG